MTRFTRYRHLIVDNIEEDTPISHDLIRAWLPNCESAMLIYDQDAGYRVFLGADPVGALELRRACRYPAELHTSFVGSPSLRRFGYELARSLRQTPAPIDEEDGDLDDAFVTSTASMRFHPQMLDWVADEIARLVHESKVPPHQIAVVAPYLSDALRFSLADRLSRQDVPTYSHRPSRALRDEPAARCLLTLVSLAHPEWGNVPDQADVGHALALAIEPLDLIRAQFLANIVYRPQSFQNPSIVTENAAKTTDHKHTPLKPFSALKGSVQERIGYQAGNRYDALRDWLYRGQRTGGQDDGADPQVTRSSSPHPLDSPLDHFLAQLFGEILSQPGYGFHRDFEAGRIAAQLIESARKFRQVAREDVDESLPVGSEYVRMVQQGVIAAQYVPAWGVMDDRAEAVLLAPAYTFLMRNRSVDYQFWLNVGSPGWWERLFQPLTHPYVLTRHWREGDVWTDANEVEARTQALHRLTQGLVRRCRVKIYLGISELGEQGYEQRGPLLQAIQQTLRRRIEARPQSAE